MQLEKIVRVDETCGPVLSRLWTKVHEILRQRRRLSYFSMPLPDCLCHVSLSRYSPLSLEIVEKTNKCEGFLPPSQFFEMDDPNFSTGKLLAQPTVHRLAKFG